MLKLCPWPSAGPQIKKLNTDNTEEHGLVFHGYIFDLILANDSWIFGGLSRICEHYGAPSSDTLIIESYYRNGKDLSSPEGKDRSV